MKPRYPNKSAPRDARPNKHADEARDLPELSEEQLAQLVSETGDALVLILDGVTDPHNLGACLRSAAAAGALAVVAPKDNAASVTDTVLRVSCGGAQVVPYVRVTNLARAMRRLQEAGMWLTGTSDQSEKSIYDQDLTGRVGLVLGAEGDGIRRLTAEHCDFLCRIPMKPGPVDCLNVSVATGVCLFEAVRQRSLR